MPQKLPKPSFTREHRLGLVVYGGVSLAIYMNGICQEFFNAVRGKGIYKLIKALTDAEIIVDILSGTSAGGINSVLLSYALTNSDQEEYIPFEEFADIWIEKGDIQKLLFNDSYDGYYKTSFFDGTNYYKTQLKNALEKREKKEASRSDWVSTVEDLDLFVTGTDLLGRIYETFDNTGRIIEVKDHRTIFHLKHRGPNRTEFKYKDENSGTYEALAKLCQITSCFPGAFPPVTVQIGDEEHEDFIQREADRLLTKWGKLKKNRKLPKLPLIQDKYDVWNVNDLEERRIKNEIEDDLGRGHRLHFVDGGVLDNRPFSYAIETIYRRTSERRVFRKLFYVDPSPDRFLDNPQYRQMRKPDLVRVVADSLSAIPRYESINKDLQLIKDHNEKVRRYKFLLADIKTLLDNEQQDNENKDMRDQHVFVYRRARLLKLKDKLVSKVYLESEDCVQDLKAEKRQVGLNEERHRSASRRNPLGQSFQTLLEELTARLDVSPELSDSLGTAHKQIDHLLRLDEDLSRRHDLDRAIELLTRPLEPDENTEKWAEYLEISYQEADGLDIEFFLRRHAFIVDYIHNLLDVDDLRGWFTNRAEQDLPGDLKAELEGDSSKDLWPIVFANQKLVKDLNRIVKRIQALNEAVDHFFSSQPVTQYFRELIKDIDQPDNARDFPFQFYHAMCFIHQELLYEQPPDGPSATLKIQPSEELCKQLKIKRKSIEESLNEFVEELFSYYPQEDLRTKLWCMAEKQVLAEISQNPQESDGSGKKVEATFLHLLAAASEKLIRDRLEIGQDEVSKLKQSGQLRESESKNFSDLQYRLTQHLKDKLTQYFSEFRKLDEFLFPLDYLSDTTEKQLIETYRISPEDARYGLSAFIMRGKRLEQKLAGDNLNAFGGFFKKSWRENDILWGRLDGLNRIVECLITDEQIQRFPSFLERQATRIFPKEDRQKGKEKYLDCLLDEALSIRTNSESSFKKHLKRDLKRKLVDLLEALAKLDEAKVKAKEKQKDREKHDEESTQHYQQRDVARCRAMLVQSIVKAGHLLIVDEQKEVNRELKEALGKSAVRNYDSSREDARIAASFRTHYNTGEETLGDIPKADWKIIKNRFFSIASDIFKTYRHKRYNQNRYRRLKAKSGRSLNREFGFPIKPVATVVMGVYISVFALLSLAVGLISLLVIVALLPVFLMREIARFGGLRKFLSKRGRARRFRLLAHRYTSSLENYFLFFLTQATTSGLKQVLSTSSRITRLAKRKKPKVKK